MSKLFPCLLLLLATGVFSGLTAQARIDATITVDGQSAKVDGKFSTPPNSLDILDSYAGVTGLKRRFSGITLNGNSFQYTVDLKPLADRTAAAHVSWIGSDTGLLTLDDLLPQMPEIRTGSVKILLPREWKIFPTLKADQTAEFANADKAVFLIARNARSYKGQSFSLNVIGSWQFTDEEAQGLTAEVSESYIRLFGGTPIAGSQINIIKFPGEVQPGEWEADTRGNTVTIVSSDTPFKSQSIQRLHEQLRHEVFHLWIPNSVNLGGQYDWFYEGFALYQSLKLGVAVNRIRFDDYLDTLTRAYAIDSFSTRRTSLVEASRTRFSGTNNTAVYARGMLVAFLIDLAMLEASKGKASSDDVVREVFTNYPLSKPRVDGNEAVLKVMRKRPELASLIDRYITGVETVELEQLLRDAGLELAVTGREKAIKVTAKPSGSQKKILEKLGYNNWRKLSRN